MGNVVPMPGFYEEYEDDAACLGRPHAQRLKNTRYVPFVPAPRGRGTPPTVLSLGLKWPPSLEDTAAQDSSRFKSATVHRRWTVEQLRDALTEMEKATDLSNGDIELSEELKIQQREIEEQLHLSMMQLETICQSFEAASTEPAEVLSRKDSFEEAEVTKEALEKGPGGVDGARRQGESGIAWEKRLQQSMRKVVDRLAERERRVVQLKVELKTERSKNAINERALREVKKQLEQVQRRVLEVSPVVATATVNNEELRRLKNEVNDLREELSRVTSERDQANRILQQRSSAPAPEAAGEESGPESSEEGVEEDTEAEVAGGEAPQALAASGGSSAPKTWDQAWDNLVESSLPAPVAQMFVGKLSTVAVGGTAAGSAVLLALALAYRRKGKRSMSEYLRQQLGM